MAVRAEYRGIGIYGNKNVAPDIEAVESEAAVARLVRPGEESIEKGSGNERRLWQKHVERLEGREQQWTRL